MLGNKTRVLLNRYDFSAGFYQVETERSVAEKDNTTFGALATTAEPGLSSDKLMLRGYFSGAAVDGVYHELKDRMGVDGAGTGLAILIDDDDANCVAVVSPDGWGQAMKLNLAAPELITFEVNTAAATDVVRGWRLYEGTFTTTGVKAAVDFDGPGTAGGWVFVFIQALTPGGSVVVLNIASAPTEGGTYTNEATISFSSRGFIATAMTGAIDKRLRLTVSDLGGATSVTACVIAAINGVTY